LAWSSDNGDTWVASAFNFNTTLLEAVYSPSTGALFVSGGGQTLFRSYGSDDWEELTSPTTTNIVGMAVDTNGRLVVLGSTDGNLYYSDNDGDSFTISTGDAFPTAFPSNRVRWFDPYFIAVGTDKTILVSTNGASWTEASSESGGALEEVHRFGSTWIAGGNSSRIWRTTNSDPSSGWAEERDIGGGDRVEWLAKFGSTLYGYEWSNTYTSSADDGDSWSSSTGSVHDVSQDTRCGVNLSSGRTLLGGIDGGIASTDNGTTFDSKTHPLDSTVRSLAEIVSEVDNSSSSLSLSSLSSLSSSSSSPSSSSDSSISSISSSSLSDSSSSSGVPQNSLGLVFGGQDTGTSTIRQDTDQYDPDSWTSKTNMPAPARYRFSSFTLSNEPHVVYGADSTTTVIRDTDRFTQGTDSWTNRADAPTSARQWNKGAALSGLGYQFAGDTGSFSPTYLSDTEEYNGGTNSWSGQTGLPSPTRSRGAVAEVDDKAYYVGGFNGGSASLADNDEYDPDTWTSKTNLVSPNRQDFAAAGFATEMYVAGGFDQFSSASLNDTDEYTPGSNSWANKTSMSSDVLSHAMATIDGLAYVFAGQNSSFDSQTWTFEYDPDGDSWSTKSSMPSPDRYHLTAEGIT